MDHCAQESEGSTLRLKELGSGVFLTVIRTLSAGEFWRETLPESPSSATLERFQPSLFEIEESAGRQSSARAYRASPIQLQASVEQMMMSVISGQRQGKLFARFGPGGSCLKTSEGSLALLMEECSEQFSGTWPTWGTALDGELGELTKPREQLTGETGFSLLDTWPTMTVSNAQGNGYQVSMDGRVYETLPGRAMAWPTPTARASNDEENLDSWLNRRRDLKEAGTNGNGCGMPLTIASQMWPTPDTNAAKGGRRLSMPTGKKVQIGLHDVAPSFPLGQETLTHGEELLCPIQAIFQLYPEKRRLNWRFVQWLMGFPEGWL